MASIDPKAFDGIPLEIVAIPLKGPGGKQGDPGKTGAPGKSNYQLWLEAGNTGTIEDFLLTTKGEKGDTGAGLVNRGLWTLGTYQPGEFVGAAKSGTDPTKVVWALVGNEEYISTLPPYLEPTKWMMLDIKAGFEDAPSDGKQYARKDGAWAEVVASGDVPRILTIDTAATVDPFARYAEWETEYGFTAESSDWGAGLNADDVAGLLFSGAKAGADAPAVVISTEGQIYWDYGGNPTGSSTTVAIPDSNRSYWIQNPRPWLAQSFHPNDLDCEGVGMLGHAIRGVGMIFKGFIRQRSTENGCRFAIRFKGGSFELYLRSMNLPITYNMFDVSGGEQNPVFTRKKPATVIPNNGYLQAHWAPAE